MNTKTLPLATRLTRAPLGWGLRLLAHLPLRALHGLSSALAPVLNHLVRYRRKVLTENLEACFPELTPHEIRRIRGQFYRNFTDNALETVKLLHISDAEMKRRFTFSGLEHIEKLFDSGKSIVAYFSHTANWEWAPSITLNTRYRPDTLPEVPDGTPVAAFCQVYRPLKDKWFDALFLHIRSRFHPHSYAKSTVLRDLLRLRRDGRVSITGFMSDQKPSHGDPTLPLMFLNRPTAMITGTETLARKLDMAVVYWDIRRVSRGHYHIDIIPMADSAAATSPGDLTRLYASHLEQTIRRDPAAWLWTHRRWKYPVTLPA